MNAAMAASTNPAMKPKIGIRIIIRIAQNTPETPEIPGIALVEAPTDSPTNMPIMKYITANNAPTTLASWTTGTYVISFSFVAGTLGCIAWVAAASGAPQPSQNFAPGDAGVPHFAHFSSFTFFTSFLNAYRASFFNLFLWFCVIYVFFKRFSRLTKCVKNKRARTMSADGRTTERSVLRVFQR